VLRQCDTRLAPRPARLLELGQRGLGISLEQPGDAEVEAGDAVFRADLQRSGCRLARFRVPTAALS
jgi:hypothetical protein